MNVLHVITLSTYDGNSKIKPVEESNCEVYGRKTSGLSGPYRAKKIMTVNPLDCIEEKDSLTGRDI